MPVVVHRGERVGDWVPLMTRMMAWMLVRGWDWQRSTLVGHPHPSAGGGPVVVVVVDGVMVGPQSVVVGGWMGQTVGVGGWMV